MEFRGSHWHKKNKVCGCSVSLCDFTVSCALGSEEQRGRGSAGSSETGAGRRAAAATATYPLPANFSQQASRHSLHSCVYGKRVGVSFDGFALSEIGFHGEEKWVWLDYIWMKWSFWSIARQAPVGIWTPGPLLFIVMILCGFLFECLVWFL